ncbi:MAG: aldo/keto reductase [Balneolales bacterium]|nr:aldo/keto reductase [Balneolales bacterium]
MKLVLGTMNFGPQVDLAEAENMIHSFLRAGYSQIDSAFVYNGGQTERMLGEIFAKIDRETFSVATKANPRITGKLDRNAILMQCNESLERMNLNYADLYYLHMPDANTPVEESLEACAQLYEQNKIKAIGLSNFPSWLVAHCVHVCERNGWPIPSVYQGLYNGISRKAEKELFACLRNYDIKFYAFNPLAGGLLTGKQLNYDADPEAGRFARLESYRKRYWKKSYFEAVNAISEVCRQFEINPAEAAYRWLAYHSSLNEHSDDAIIIGASSMKQFDENIAAVSNGILPDVITEAFDLAWSNAMNESPDYFYFYKS